MFEASVNKFNAADVTISDWNRDTPFHKGRKSIHRLMSARASALSVILWFKGEAFVDRAIRRRRNIRPGLTHLQAKDNEPINDNNSLWVHFFLCIHALSNVESSWNLSGGSWTLWAVTSYLRKLSIVLDLPSYPMPMELLELKRYIASRPCSFYNKRH